MVAFHVIHTILFYLLVGISFIVGTFITWIFSLFTKDKRHAYQVAAKIWAGLLLFFSGMRIQCKGFKNLPKNTGLILISNHQGAADIPILLAKSPVLFHFVIKKELFKVPFFGWYLKKAGYLSIDREKGSSAIKTLEEAEQMLRQGESILIFPEGTRSLDENLGPFKRGSLLLAFKSKAPVIPIAINGTLKVQKKGSWLLYPNRITLTVGAPINIAHKENPAREDQDRELYRIRDAIIALLED